MSWIFIFKLLCGSSKGFMKAFKALRASKTFWGTTEKCENKNLNCFLEELLLLILTYMLTYIYFFWYHITATFIWEKIFSVFSAITKDNPPGTLNINWMSFVSSICVLCPESEEHNEWRKKMFWVQSSWTHLSPVCNALRDLTPFAQFKKGEKHP